MEPFDREKAARVWQRVQSRDGLAGIAAAAEGPGELLLQVNALAGLYMGLQRMTGGKTGERFRALYRSLRRTADCLRGLCRLEGTAPGLPPMETGKGTVQERLRSCAHRERRLGQALARLGMEGEFAPVSARMAKDSWERCATVLEILGATEKE